MSATTTTTRTIRTGLIGFGLAGRVFHGPFLATNPAFRLDLISTSSPERAAAALADHPEATVVSTAQELLARASELDLVVIASPVTAHLEQGLAVLNAGLAVVIDKPFVPSVLEAKKLIARAEETGGMLTVFHNRRWDADFLTLRGLVAEGVLGRVHRFESTFEKWGRPVADRWQDSTPGDLGGGVAFDLGSHLVDQALQLFGPAEVELAEFRSVREGSRNEDDAVIALRHRDGVLSHLTMSRVAGQSGPRFRALGDTSAFVSYGLDIQEPQLKAGIWPDHDDYGVTPESGWGTVGVDGGVLERIPLARGGYPSFYDGVAAAILEGAPAPVEPREALEVVRIIERAHALMSARGV
jgi:predicted dehydrogenase